MKCILGHVAKTATILMLLVGLSSTVACKPGQFLQRNACELLNCDMLFFIDDLFPLAAQSGGGGASDSTDMDMDDEDDGGGHMH